MSRPMRFLAAARQEFDRAYDEYERNRPGWGERFADRVQYVLDRIQTNPRLHAVVMGNVRKGVVAQFPFCIYYREEPTCIRVLAVFHTSRNPKVWQRRAGLP